MATEWLVRIVLFSVVHWALAGIMLTDLAARGRVTGGRKAPWAGIIMVVPCFGSLAYLLAHPDILRPADRGHD